MTSPRQRLRGLGLGLATLTGVKRRGFWIPYRYAHVLPDAGERAPYRPIERLFADLGAAFDETLAGVERFAADLTAIGAGDPAPGPRWNQDWFPRMDAAVAYAMVRSAEPARVVEVGSGHSTRFMARAIADGRLATRLVAIDPKPKAAIDRLGIGLRRETLNATDPAVFSALEPGDILFVDSSHIAMPGSDVDDLVNRVLPALRPGVLVHIHDIFLPDDYPPSWDWRGYNEQLAVAPLVMGGAWRVLFASRYVATRHGEKISAGVLGRLPLPEGAFETSLWLAKR